MVAYKQTSAAPAYYLKKAVVYAGGDYPQWCGTPHNHRLAPFVRMTLRYQANESFGMRFWVG